MKRNHMRLAEMGQIAAVALNTHTVYGKYRQHALFFLPEMKCISFVRR